MHVDQFRGKPLQFFDFFCGPGQDSNGVHGSPLILLHELQSQRAAIEQHPNTVNILFNDGDASKIDNLKQLCGRLNVPWNVQFEQLEFAQAFEKLRSKIGNAPSLIFIDQNGLKHISKAIFAKLTAAQTTDFIFFTASSFKRRFGDLLAPEIKFPQDVSHLEVHRELAAIYRGWAPAGIFIGHFSIKKDSNIYGLVFGSQHWRGMQKFLEIAWRLDEQSGEADYEIEAGIGQGTLDFGTGQSPFKKRKIEAFQDSLTEGIRGGKFATDQDVFLHCLVNGFLPGVAKSVYHKLRGEGLVGRPRYSADVMKESRNLSF